MFQCWATKLFTIFLVLVLSPWGGVEAAPLSIQEQLVLIPVGSVIEIKTKAKKKLRGQLLGLAKESFEVQIAQRDTVGKQSFRFDEVKSVRDVGKHSGWRTSTKILVGVAAGLVVLAILTVVALSRAAS